MAVRLPYTVDRLGLTMADAYIRIVSYSGDKAQTTYGAGVYTSKTARQAGADPVDRASFRAKLSDLSGGWFPSLYTHLKSLPQFAGALDEV